MSDAFKKVSVNSISTSASKPLSVEGACWGGAGSAFQVIK